MQETDRLILCKHCFARLSGIKDSSVSTEERGKYSSSLLFDRGLAGQISSGNSEACALCHGILDRIEDLCDAVIPQIGGREFDTFLVGCSLTPEQEDIENFLKDKLKFEPEKLKKELNRKLGVAFQNRTGKEVSFDDPDIIINFDFTYASFKIRVKPLYIFGIYRKLKRGVPQTRWIHRSGGDDSVEAQIGKCLNLLTMGEEFHLHGSGREDVDVRMLGNGREFVIESVDPRKRKINLDELQSAINTSDSISVSGLRYSSKKEVIRIKSSAFNKSYRAKVLSDSPIDSERLGNAALNLTGKDIYQRTPLRVTGSRSDLVRKRQVLSCQPESVSRNEAVLAIKAEAGTYIKELIHGDGGRTQPSLSSLYGEELKVLELDVIWIHRDGE